MKIKPTVPPVALAIELLALLVEHDYPFSLSFSYTLIGVAAVACLVSLIGSAQLFKQQAVISVFCILVSMSAVVPTLFALATEGTAK